MKTIKNIEDLIQEKLTNFKLDTSEDLNAKIQNLANKKAKQLKLKKLKLKVFSISSFLIIISGIVFYFLYSEEPKIKNDIINSKIIESNENKISIEDKHIDTLDNWEIPRVEIPNEVIENIEITTVEEPEEVNNINEIVEDNSSQKIIKSSHNVILPRFPNTALGKAKYDAFRLQKGALLVRLKTKQNAIKAYAKRGNIERAEAIRKYVNVENRRIVKVFKENFDFCEVQFFFSSATDSIKQNIRKGIFLDEDLQIDKNIDLTDQFIMIADIGEGFTNGLLNRVILISDSNFKPLKKPFPYYQRASKMKNDSKYVRKLSEKMQKIIE